MPISPLCCCVKYLGPREGPRKSKSATNLSNMDRTSLKSNMVKAMVLSCDVCISKLDFEPVFGQLWPQNFFWAPPHMQLPYMSLSQNNKTKKRLIQSWVMIMDRSMIIKKSKMVMKWQFWGRKSVSVNELCSVFRARRNGNVENVI